MLVLQMNENRLEQYEETNKNITFWTISTFINILFSNINSPLASTC